MFVATVVYELGSATEPKAAKLFRAELVGRRYKEQWEGQPLPRNAVWIRRTTEAGETVDDLKERCRVEVASAAQAVKKAGLALEIACVWVHVMGGGTFGLVDVGA